MKEKKPRKTELEAKKGKHSLSKYVWYIIFNVI